MTPLPPAHVATELLELLTDFGRCCPLPAIQALHLPPLEAAGTKDGEFCALELDDGSFGLSYVRLDSTLARLLDMRQTLSLQGMPALELARTFASGTGAQRALGFAAVNALSHSLLTRAAYVFDADSDSLGGLAPGPTDHVGMIGFFTPLIPRLVDSGARLTVVELDPSFIGEFAAYRVTADASALQACNKILSTSTVLLNDTLDSVLAQCRQAAWFAMVGPNAGCLPDPLFSRGVSAIGGVRVIDRAAFVAALTSGQRWGPHVRKYAMTRSNYPGTRALLERIAGGGW